VNAHGVRKAHLDGLASATLLALCFAWGLNQVAIKVANAGIQPVFQAGLRSFLACILVVAWCRLRAIPLFERDGTLASGLVVGVLFAVEFVLLFVGFDMTSVSHGIILLYSAPLVVAIGAHFLLPGERLTAVKCFGLLLSFVGVAVALADREALPSREALLGDVLCLAAGIVWGATTLTVRLTRVANASPEKTMVYQLAVSAVLLLPLSPLFGSLLRPGLDGVVIAAFAYQTIVVVAASYAVWFWLLARYPASQLSAFTFLTPLFAVFLGWLLLAEPVSPWLLAALVLVGLGIHMVNRRPTVAATAGLA
jgi:drug/metabolite transporter (DMT)-like permease